MWRFIERIHNSRKLKYPFKQFWKEHLIWQLTGGDTSTIIMLNPVLICFSDIDIIELASDKRIHLILLMVDPMDCLSSEMYDQIHRLRYCFANIYTMDFTDAERYGWKHTWNYYSIVKPETGLIAENSDIFFCGWNKGRLATLLQIYDTLCEKGIRCLFYITGVSDKEAKENARSGVVYNCRLSYSEMIAKVQTCNVVLEICQKGQNGGTLRMFDAVTSNKKLLTNNQTIRSFPFYDCNYMRCIQKLDDIVEINVEWFRESSAVDYGYRDQFSPCRLFDEIEKKEIN